MVTWTQITLDGIFIVGPVLTIGMVIGWVLHEFLFDHSDHQENRDRD